MEKLTLDPNSNAFLGYPYPYGFDPVSPPSGYAFVLVPHSRISDLDHLQEQAELLEFVQNEDVRSLRHPTNVAWGLLEPTQLQVGPLVTVRLLPRVALAFQVLPKYPGHHVPVHPATAISQLHLRVPVLYDPAQVDRVPGRRKDGGCGAVSGIPLRSFALDRSDQHVHAEESA